jgi:hypothetical protein
LVGYAAYSDLPGYSSGPSFGVVIGIVAGAAVGAGGYLMKTDPQPATKPLSSYQAPESSAPSPPAPPAPTT